MTSEPKWTAGEWRYQEQSDAYTHIVRAGDRFIVQFPQSGKETSEANARLTAAAPDLYEALEECLGAMTGGMDGRWSADVDPVDMARNALQKARGKS